jgi:leucyl aminopeptidase
MATPIYIISITNPTSENETNYRQEITIIQQGPRARATTTFPASAPGGLAGTTLTGDFASVSSVGYEALAKELILTIQRTFEGKGAVDYTAATAAQVKKLVDGKSAIKDVRVVRGQQLVDLGMNLLYSVGKGATSEPRCIAVYYRGNSEKDDVDVAFVGKGITFDTGGLHLKPYGGMEQMFLDKGGACSVLGALHGALELGIKMNVVFGMGLAENAIDAKSYKPMDIISSISNL